MWREVEWEATHVGIDEEDTFSGIQNYVEYVAPEIEWEVTYAGSVEEDTYSGFQDFVEYNLNRINPEVGREIEYVFDVHGRP